MPSPSSDLRTALICHADAALDLEGLSRWLGAFSELAGIVVLEEPRWRQLRRVGHEIRRLGVLRLADVLAFRLYYRAFLRGRDRQWERDKLAELLATYPPLPTTTRILHAPSPNAPEVERFLRELAPGIVVARCKTSFDPGVFTIPARGTLVLHPGICPEYRNAHGCFWALANDDLDKVGMTLLQFDRGVDTGPIHGYFRCPYDDLHDTHVVIQHRMVLDNLDAIREALSRIHEGSSTPVDVQGRPSGEWGQPWLTAYLGWKRRARRRRSDALRAAVS